MHRSSLNVLCLAAAAALTAGLGGGLLPALAASGQQPAVSRAAAAGAASAAAGAATAGASGAPGAVTAASRGATGGGSTATIPADVLPGLNLLAPTGPAPAGRVLQVGVALSLPDPSAVGTYVASEYDPSSPEYHHFLTPAGFAERFGVPASTYARVLSWLRSGGLTIDETTQAGDWVEASGTVSQLDRLFGTTIDRYTSKGVTFLANTTPPVVPAGDSILSVVGLNTLQRFSTPKAPQVPQQAPAVPGCLPTCFYGPQDMWSMYDMPSSDLGQGQTLAVFGEGQTADVISNLRVFEKDNNLPQVPVTVDHVGPGPFTDDSGQVEWDLDTQASTGMAPDAYGVTMYFANSLYDASVESLFQAWVNDPNGPKQANASFGECETNPTNPVTGPLAQLPYGTELGDELEPVAEATLEQAVAEGRTLFASAGDTGSSCPVLVLPVVGAGNGVANQAVPFDNYPCASDWAVCVGGTELYSDGANPPHRALETAWEFTGGGAAPFQAEPAFQKGDPAVDIPCLVDQTGSPFPPGTICRGAPDVAAMSGNVYDNGYDIVANGAPTVEGGTSLSSPLWVGMWTRIQAAAPAVVTTAAAPRSSARAKQETVTSVTYPGLGFADYSIYRVGESPAYSKDFYDITIGDNGYYHAAPGWDYVSGWGVPDVAHLMSTLDGSETPTNDVMPPPPTNPSGSCNALWTNPAHTATDLFGNSDPQLTLLEGNMAPSADGKSLVVELMVEDLTKTVPTGATGEDWYMTWTYKGTTYFAQAQLSALPGSAPGFFDGTVNAVGTSHNYQTVNTDTGELVTGHDGVVEIDVPLAHIGNPAPGSVLGQPTGLTYIEVGVPPNPTGLSAGSLQQVDSGGPGSNYTVGTTTGTSGCTPSE